MLLVFPSHLILRFFFFFQAEDGIRDLTVTGVQTCALPIWYVLGSKQPAYRVTTRAGRDITTLVNGSGGQGFVGDPGETLLVQESQAASSGTVRTESHQTAIL